jgi:galactose-1-phosphate uridylyltransferase
MSHSVDGIALLERLFGPKIVTVLKASGLKSTERKKHAADRTRLRMLGKKLTMQKRTLEASLRVQKRRSAEALASLENQAREEIIASDSKFIALQEAYDALKIQMDAAPKADITEINRLKNSRADLAKELVNCLKELRTANPAAYDRITRSLTHSFEHQKEKKNLGIYEHVHRLPGGMAKRS